MLMLPPTHPTRQTQCRYVCLDYTHTHTKKDSVLRRLQTDVAAIRSEPGVQHQQQRAATPPLFLMQESLYSNIQMILREAPVEVTYVWWAKQKTKRAPSQASLCPVSGMRHLTRSRSPPFTRLQKLSQA